MKKGVSITIVLVVLALGLVQISLLLTLNSSILSSLIIMQHNCLNMFSYMRSNQTEMFYPAASRISKDSEPNAQTVLVFSYDEDEIEPAEERVQSNLETEAVTEVSVFETNKTEMETKIASNPEMVSEVLSSEMDTKPMETTIAWNPNTEIVPHIPEDVLNEEIQLLEPNLPTISFTEDFPDFFLGLGLKSKEVSEQEDQTMKKNISESDAPDVLEVTQTPSEFTLSVYDDSYDDYEDY